MSCRCDFDLASSDLRTPGPGHKQSMYQQVRTTESDAACCWPRAHDRDRVIQVQSPGSTLHHMSRSIPHMARDVEISHLPPSTFEFDYLAVHHCRADAQRIRLGAYNGSERCRASQEPAVSTTRRARCTVHEKMPDPKHSRAHPASPPVGVLEGVVRRPSTVAV